MSQKIKIRRSAVPAKIPTTEQLDLGEIAINTHDGKMFIKVDDGVDETIIAMITELGGTLGGFLTLHAAPTSDMHAATKKYVDDNAGGGAPVLQGSDITANSNTTYTIDLADGGWRKITFSSNCTLAFTFPSGEVNSLILEMVNAGSYTITWPGGMKWNNAVAPNLTATGTDLIMITRDGNNNYYGNLISQAAG